jgi:hypothetical protein
MAIGHAAGFAIPRQPVAARRARADANVNRSCYAVGFGLSFVARVVAGLVSKPRPAAAAPAAPSGYPPQRTAPPNSRRPIVVSLRPARENGFQRVFSFVAGVVRKLARLRDDWAGKLRAMSAAVSARKDGLWEYVLVTGAYWGFTITDGAIRMLVLLQFFFLGYSAFQIAALFLFYEIFGVVTNLVGGWIGTNWGLRITLFGGSAIQVVALAMMALLSSAWPVAAVVAWVMAAQALSGIAKDLNKMSAKSAIKSVVPAGAESTLYRWVALLTGSKNALKGVGFFVGALLFTLVGFAGASLLMAGGLIALLIFLSRTLPKELGAPKKRAKFSAMFSMDRRINILSAARLFLFGARDVWFVVALPVYFAATFGWSPIVVGAYLALWTIGYGIVQSIAPRFVCAKPGETPKAYTVTFWASVLAAIPIAIALAIGANIFPAASIVVGLAIFGVVFAVNSAVHSYMIVHYAESEKVAMTIGFYYMANAGGRLLGTVLSGLIYQWLGIVGCLWVSGIFVGTSALISSGLSLPARRDRRTLAPSDRLRIAAAVAV